MHDPGPFPGCACHRASRAQAGEVSKPALPQPPPSHRSPPTNCLAQMPQRRQKAAPGREGGGYLQLGQAARDRRCAKCVSSRRLHCPRPAGHNPCARQLMSQLPRLPCRLLERAAGHGSIHGAGVGVQSHGSAAGRQRAEGRAAGQGPCASGDQCYAGPGALVRDRPAGVLCAGPESLPADGAVRGWDMGRERDSVLVPESILGHHCTALL